MEAILPNSARNENADCSLKNTFIVLFIIVVGTFSLIANNKL